ncbi:MAG TPA: hypothetical protein VI457_16365 [Methylococcaceae bacterium]|nr:hypothetical protein [Methylococcaceae bacterium]
MRFVLFAALLAASFRGEAGDVTRTDDPHWSGRRYASREGNCRIEVLQYTSGINRGTLKNFSECSLPWAERRETLRAVLRAIQQDDPDFAFSRHLFWGTVAERDPEASCRLAQAAAASPRWDAHTGRVRSKNDNLVVRRLLQEADVYRELREIYADLGYRLEVGGIEKVGVMEGKRLACAGLKQRAKLPFDALIGFRIEAMEQKK